jgi:hypothetical protein
MDPIYPWLDPVEVRHLADQLLRPVKQPAVSLSDAGFNDAFVGFASDPSFPQTTSPPFEAVTETSPPLEVVIDPSPPFIAVGKIPREPGPDELSEPSPAPPLPDDPIQETEPPPEQATAPAVSEDPASLPEPAIPARGPFLERIQYFRDWMRHHFDATGIFILDREGIVIFDESNHGRLHFLARSLALASRRPGATAGNVHVKIGAGATLEVIPVETAYGCLVLGAVVPDSMDPTAVAAVMTALSEVASPHSGH